MALAEHLEAVERETAAAQLKAKSAKNFNDSRAHWHSLREKLPWGSKAKPWAEDFAEYLAVVRVVEARASLKPSNLICNLTLQPFARLKAVAVDRSQHPNRIHAAAAAIVLAAIEEPKTLQKALSDVLKRKEIESYRYAMEDLLAAACYDAPERPKAIAMAPSTTPEAMRHGKKVTWLIEFWEAHPNASAAKIIALHNTAHPRNRATPTDAYYAKRFAQIPKKPLAGL